MKLTIGKINIEINLSISWDKNMKEVKNALREGNRLLAIKIYKHATGEGLRESKEAVDKLLPKYYKDYKPPVPQPNPKAGAERILENSEFGAMSKIKYTHGVYHADEIKPISIGSYIECNKYIIWNVPPLTRDKYSIKPLGESELKNYNVEI